MKTCGKFSSFLGRSYLMIVLLLISTMGVAQDIVVKGKVIDSNGEPIIGASIMVVGTTNGTITNIDGFYTLSNVPSDGVIKFSYLGMKAKSIQVSGRKVINVTLAEDTKVLDEVVVTALGMKRKTKALGYAVTEIKADELNSNVINPVSALQGKVAGVEISQSDGGMFGSTKIQIRGVSTLGSNNQPIYVVDGIILDNATSNSGDADWNSDSGDYGNELKNLNPDDFESVSVLKGAAATALFGSRGLNGAVVITTKSGKSGKGLGVNVSQTFGVDHVFAQPDLQNLYGDGVFSGYLDYGEKDADGEFYRFDNQRQFMTNSDGKRTLIGSGQGTGFGPRFDGQEIETYDHTYVPYRAYKNNFKDTYDLGLNSNTHISVSGGNEKTTFYTSLSYRYAKGTLPNNSFKRISMMAKATHKITDKVKLEANISFANSEPRNSQPNIGEYFASGTFSRSYDTDYFKRKYKGVHGGIASNSYGDEYGSVPGKGIWWSIYENDFTQKETSVRPSLVLNVDLAKWVKFRAEGNYNYYYVRSEGKYPGTGYANEKSGAYSIAQSMKEQTNLNASFTFDKVVNDFHFNGFVRGEYFNNIVQSSDLSTSEGLIIPNKYFIKNSLKPVSYDASINQEKRILSASFQAAASYKDQLFLDVTGRNDWSSALVYTDGHGNYSYFYPSVSGSWLIHETFELPKFITFAKLRASWAQVGNDTDPYLVNSAYTIGASTVASGNSYYSLSLPTQIISRDLKPERKNSWEVGLDWRFFDNRFGIDATYYKENTKDQIMEISVPEVSGVTSQLVNAGNIENKGIELAINTVPFVNKDWRWNLDFTYTKNMNKIVSLHKNVADYITLEGSPNYGNYRVGSVAKVGSAYGLLMTDANPQIDEKTGKKVLQYSNTNRFALYKRSGKVEEIGSMVPDFLGSVSTGLKYKNWSLRVLMDMRFGGKITSYNSRYGTAYGYTKTSLKYRDPEHGGMTWTSAYDGLTYHDGLIPDGIFPAGTKINQPNSAAPYVVADGGETYQQLYDKKLIEPTHASVFAFFNNQWGTGVTNDDWVTTLNYIALREVSLSYGVPSTFCSKLGLKRLNLTLTGRNLGYLLNSLPNNENPESVRGTNAAEFRIRSFEGYTANYTFTINASF